MKILLIGNEVSDRYKIKNYSDVWSFYLSKSLKKYGVDLSYLSQNGCDSNDYQNKVVDAALVNDCDHIVALGVRFFSRIESEIGKSISKKFHGLVCQIHDASLLDSFPVDMNLTVRDDAYRFADNANNRMTRHLQYNRYIGWAADKDLFYPEKIDDAIFRVFVDHSTFTESSPDNTLNILMSLSRFRKDVRYGKFNGYSDVEVLTLGNDGVEIVDLDNICVKPYNKYSVPIEELAINLRRSHVFFATHKESVGLSILEAAFAGNFIVAPEGAINPDRISCVRHHVFSSTVDWGLVVDSISPEKSSLYVQGHNWDNVAIRVVKSLIDGKKRNWS